jgi:hypothetical protein
LHNLFLRKKNKKSEKKMTQITEKVMEKKGLEHEEIEGNEPLGELNPRYFEEGMTPENGLEKVRASQVGFSGINLVRPY